MITEVQAVALLRAANPVPHPETDSRDLDAATRLDDTEQGTEEMIKTEPQPTGQRRRGWTTGLVAAAAVLVLGVATLLLTRVDNPFAGPNPTEIAESYIDARNDYDAERALELISEGFKTNESPDGYVDAATLERAFQWHETEGFKFTDVLCEQSGETPDWISVTCEATWTVRLREAGGFPPGDYRLMLLIQDGLIIQAFESGLGGPDWESWVRFLETEHPDFGDVVFRAINLEPDALQTHAEEMPRYVDLWKEWLDSQEG